MIKISDVSFKYKNGQNILDNINLEVNEGEFICIIGKNGSGKSTLARVISGIVAPTKGKVIIDEIDSSDKKNTLNLRKKVGIVFQNPENQIMFNRVYDDIAFGLNNIKVDNVEERVKNSLNKVKMQEYLDKDTYELSLGQKQRVVIASALSVQPKYLIFDEPTTMLDSEGKEDVYNTIVNLKKEGYTIIYITNLMDEILLSDKIVIMEKGKIASVFNKEDILDNLDLLNNGGFKVPKVVKILSELKKEGIDIRLKDWTIGELTAQIIEVFKK